MHNDIDIREEKRAQRIFIGSLVVSLVLRTWTAASLPLFSVEAYYWLWGRHLACGYVDHPPMVAWVSALFLGFVNGSELAARCSAIVLGTLSPILLFILAKSLFHNRALACNSGALLAAIPMFNLNGTLLQPDNALIFFILLTWLLFWRAAETGSVWMWTLAGVAAGGALLSKFHAWVLLPPLWVFLLLSREHRRRLLQPGPWLAVLMAMAVLSPNLIWNYRNDWLNYRFQWKRSSIPQAQFQWADLVQYVIIPFITLSPLVYPAILRSVLVKTTAMLRKDADSRLLFLICAGLPLPLFLGLLSPFVAISPHWPSAAFPALILLALYGSWCKWPGIPRSISMIVSAAITTIMLFSLPYIVPLLPSNLALPVESRLHNTGRIQGDMLDWRRLGKEVGDRARSSGADLYAKDWHMAALLAFYADMTDNTFAFDPVDAHNFGIWERAKRDSGRRAMILMRKEDPLQRHKSLSRKLDRYERVLDGYFEDIRPERSFLLMRNGRIQQALDNEVSPDVVAEFLAFSAVRKDGNRGGDR